MKVCFLSSLFHPNKHSKRCSLVITWTTKNYIFLMQNQTACSDKYYVLELKTSKTTETQSWNQICHNSFTRGCYVWICHWGKQEQFCFISLVNCSFVGLWAEKAITPWSCSCARLCLSSRSFKKTSFLVTSTTSPTYQMNYDIIYEMPYLLACCHGQ